MHLQDAEAHVHLERAPEGGADKVEERVPNSVAQFHEGHAPPPLRVEQEEVVEPPLGEAQDRRPPLLPRVLEQRQL